MIFEYLAYNRVPLCLIIIGLVGFIVSFMLLIGLADSTYSKPNKNYKIFAAMSFLMFFIGIFLPSENYYEKKNKRLKIYQEISNDVDKYIDYKLEKIKSDISFIKDKIVSVDDRIDNVEDKIEK